MPLLPQIKHIRTKYIFCICFQPKGSWKLPTKHLYRITFPYHSRKSTGIQFPLTVSFRCKPLNRVWMLIKSTNWTFTYYHAHIQAINHHWNNVLIWHMHTDTTFRYLSIVASSFRNCEAHYIPADIEKLYQMYFHQICSIRVIMAFTILIVYRWYSTLY